MAITLPNINDWIADLNGRLLPFGWAKLAWRLLAKPPRSVRMPLMGVRKKYHNTALGAALSMAGIARIRDYHIGRGTQSGELSWILEDNTRMRHMIELLGGKPTRPIASTKSPSPDHPQRKATVFHPRPSLRIFIWARCPQARRGRISR